jgi:hypothetical protein
MKARKRKRVAALSQVICELNSASWETIARRSLMMAQGTCSPAEYQRMIAEKAQAAAASSVILMTGGGRAPIAALLAPWRSRARANAKRLRRK